jgi:type II secretory pathway component PulJ
MRSGTMSTQIRTEEILAKLELIEVQARATLALAKDIRQMLAARPVVDPEATLEIPLQTLAGRKAA